MTKVIFAAAFSHFNRHPVDIKINHFRRHIILIDQQKRQPIKTICTRSGGQIHIACEFSRGGIEIKKMNNIG
jgi:hypothetical protein